MTLTGSQPTSVLYIVQMCSAVVMPAIDSVVGHKGKNMYQMLLMNGWTHGRGESWHGPRLLAVMADPVVVVEESQDGDLQCWERMEAETQFVQELMALQHKMWSDMKKHQARRQRDVAVLRELLKTGMIGPFAKPWISPRARECG